MSLGAMPSSSAPRPADSAPDEPVTASEADQYISHVKVPSQKQVEQALIERRKQELLSMYATDELQQEAHETRTMLGL